MSYFTRTKIEISTLPALPPTQRDSIRKCKIVFSSNPITNIDYSVMYIDLYNWKSWFVKLSDGDRGWTKYRAQPKGYYGVEDILHYKKKLYVIASNYVNAFDPDTFDCVRTKLPSRDLCDFHVFELSGDLILFAHHHTTASIYVYRLDISEGK
ncbi:hypothetical protein GIB67_025416 [Kingdonia uniflora]|uniref:KIB1-4 beta-propeller domain-containing protein n=1 Tax=Kingdonia uniflora TaxID=39325 RepID=A0A7J7LJ92_9MAGN|nr:hypothetical protein GIB67_025416 [Kingdonia uniflora]